MWEALASIVNGMLTSGGAALVVALAACGVFVWELRETRKMQRELFQDLIRTVNATRQLLEVYDARLRGYLDGKTSKH